MNIESIKNNINKFYNSNIYLILLSIFTGLTSLVADEPIIATILYINLALNVVLISICSDNLLPVIPLGIMFMISADVNFKNVNMMLIIIPILISVIALLLHVIFKTKKITFKTDFGIGFLALGITFMLSFINIIEHISNPSVWGFMLYGLFIIICYFVFNSSLINKEFSNYISKVFMFVGLVLSFQIFAYYAMCDDILIAFKTKSLRLPWGVSNSMAKPMHFSIFLTLYLYLKNNENKLYLLAFVIQLLAFILTMSRGGYVAFIVTIIPALIYLYKKSINKKILLISGGITTLLFIGLLFTPSIQNLIEWMLSNMSNSRGRDWLFEIGIERWKENPILGTTMLLFNQKDHFSQTLEFGVMLYHNTFLHSLVCFGIIGLLALLYHFYEIIKFYIKNINTYSIFVLFTLIASNIHGLFDNTYFNQIFMFNLTIILISLTSYKNNITSYNN